MRNKKKQKVLQVMQRLLLFLHIILFVFGCPVSDESGELPIIVKEMVCQ